MTRATEARGGGLRRDALANQERVLAAAVTAVLREGRQVPMATIAADAGVGVGTLYRRYPPTGRPCSTPSRCAPSGCSSRSPRLPKPARATPCRG